MWERQSRPWFISLLMRKHSEEWLVVLHFFAHLWQHRHIIRQAYACIRRDCNDSIHCSCISLFAHYTCKRAPGPTSSCRPADQRYSSVETCVGDRVSSFIPKTHPHARSLILAHPLITHTDALERQKRKMLCMQNRWAAYTRVRVKKEKETEEVERCVCARACLCVMQAHFVVYESSLKLFKIAHQSCVRI